MTTRRRRAYMGSMTNFSRSIRPGLRRGCSRRSPSSATLLPWAVRVVIRSMTGESNVSLISSAAPTKSLASAESLGSSMGIRANAANRRLSCSFCDECMLGSSAETRTNPPLTPV